MERGAMGELIRKSGSSGIFSWLSGWNAEREPNTEVFVQGVKVATFWGHNEAIRLERVALFLTTEQS